MVRTVPLTGEGGLLDGSWSFVKLDCEGAEAMSLKGARKLLRETPPVVILVEIMKPHSLPIYRETLKEYGYAIYSLWGGDSNLPCDTGCEPMRATYWEDHNNRSSDHAALQASLLSGIFSQCWPSGHC